MAEFDDLPQRAFAPRLTRMQGDVEDPYSTADILNNMPQPTFTDWLRQNAPEGGPADDSTPWSQFASRVSRTGKNIVGGGMNTVANWLDWKPKVGPDTIAPTGVGFMGTALAHATGALPKNAVGVFGGELAHTADHAALAKAKEMASGGIDRDTIWKETGWGLGPDGKWRFEIDDSGAKFGEAGISWDQLNAGTPLQSVMRHDDLVSAYPNVNPTLSGDAGGGGGVFRPASNEIGLGGVLPQKAYGSKRDLNRNIEGQRGTALHEIQHAIQKEEGFAPGSSPNEFIYQNDPMFQHRKSWESPADAYKRVAGEVEARNVSKRKDMSADERRATPPWKTQDVPDEQQIVRLLSDQSRASVPGTVINSLELDRLRREDAMPRPAAVTPKEALYGKEGDLPNPIDMPQGGAAIDAYQALLQSKGDLGKARNMPWMAAQHGPQHGTPEPMRFMDSGANNVLDYWRDSGANFRAFADPERSGRYWQALEEFKSAERPPFLSADTTRSSVPGTVINALGEQQLPERAFGHASASTRPDTGLGHQTSVPGAFGVKSADKKHAKTYEKQESDYRAEGTFLRPEHDVEPGMVPLSAFNGKDIRASQQTVTSKSLNHWKKQIKAGERPSVLLEETGPGKYRIVDGHTRATAYSQLGIDEDIPVLIRKSRESGDAGLKKQESSAFGLGHPDSVQGAEKARGYHGTLNDFDRFQTQQNYMIDRALGPHFAADPEVSNSFIMERINGKEIGPKEGGRMMPVDINARFLDVPQPKFDWAKDNPEMKSWQAIPSDQNAIEKMVMAEAYRRDPDLLARYLMEARAIPEADAIPMARELAAGKEVFIPTEGKAMGLERFIDNFGGKPYNDADRALAVDLARQSWLEQGYQGLRYKNTSPMEMATAQDPTAYVMFGPNTVKSATSGETLFSKPGGLPLIDREEEAPERAFRPKR